MGFRLDVLVAMLMTVAPLLMMAVHEHLPARLAGLALTQSLQLAGMLQWMVRQSAEVENNMTSGAVLCGSAVQEGCGGCVHWDCAGCAAAMPAYAFG